METKKSNAQEKLNEGTNSNPVTNKDMDDYVMAQEKTVQANLNVENSEKAKKLAIQQTQEKIDQAIGAQKRWSDIVTQSANVFMNFGMGLSMISNMID
ncbi:hypothetical protein IJ384_07540 [bacterium]|nr:hypothetical protein [bacterium]